MIQIQRPEQFRRAAERLLDEPQSIRRHEPGLWLVTNKKKNHTYAVRVEQRDGRPFITCTCEAGTPSNHRHAPLVCKHAAAVVIYLRALRAMKRHAASRQ